MAKPYGDIISGSAYEKWVKANRKKLHVFATLLREAADHLDSDGLPMVSSKEPQWGTVILVTDGTNSGHLNLKGVPNDYTAEAALDCSSKRIKAVVGKKAIANCRAVVVIPACGKTVRVTAEPKDA